MLRAVLSFASFTVYVLYYLLFRQKEQDRDQQVRRGKDEICDLRYKTFFDQEYGDNRKKNMKQGGSGACGREEYGAGRNKDQEGKR